jgi:hypothetical protein
MRFSACIPPMHPSNSVSGFARTWSIWSEASIDEFKIPDDLEDDRDVEEAKKTSIKVMDIRDIASMSIDVGLIKWVMDKAG